MKKLFVSALTVFALTNLVVAPYAFAEQELETIVIRGQRAGCSGDCARSFLDELRDAAGRVMNDWIGSDTLPDNDLGEHKPEPLLLVDDMNACETSQSDRTNHVNASFLSGFSGQFFPVGTIVDVQYADFNSFRFAGEQFRIERDTSPTAPSGIGTLKPVADSLKGC